MENFTSSINSKWKFNKQLANSLKHNRVMGLEKYHMFVLPHRLSEI